MECAAVFTVAQVLGMRAGAVLQVIWNKEREKAGLEVVMDRDTTSGIQTVIEGIRILMQQEKSEKKEVKNAKHKLQL
ncbi:MAG: hypothetical protein RSB97_08115, partial [Christensenella sp.]